MFHVWTNDTLIESYITRYFYVNIRTLCNLVARKDLVNFPGRVQEFLLVRFPCTPSTTTYLCSESLSGSRRLGGRSRSLRKSQTKSLKCFPRRHGFPGRSFEIRGGRTYSGLPSRDVLPSTVSDLTLARWTTEGRNHDRTSFPSVRRGVVCVRS